MLQNILTLRAYILKNCKCIDCLYMPCCADAQKEIWPILENFTLKHFKREKNDGRCTKNVFRQIKRNLLLKPHKICFFPLLQSC